MVMLFPISINLTELLKRFRHLSVSVVCGAIEQELRDQGEVMRLVLIIIIIITFIYTAQIQLYSFQMRLTIKDLKIYRKKKITTLNYNIISEKAFLKRWVFKLRLKTWKSEVHLRSNGRLFHSFGAAATKARSPRVGRVLKLGFESRYLLFDLRL